MAKQKKTALKTREEAANVLSFKARHKEMMMALLHSVVFVCIISFF